MRRKRRRRRKGRRMRRGRRRRNWGRGRRMKRKKVVHCSKPDAKLVSSANNKL